MSFTFEHHGCWWLQHTVGLAHLCVLLFLCCACCCPQVFMVLLNFLLAIIVDAFSEVKEKTHETVGMHTELAHLLRDKWRSLLMGRPPYIRHDEWDVTELDDDDFCIDGQVSSPDTQTRSATCAPQFQSFARLSCLVDEVQHRLLLVSLPD